MQSPREFSVVQFFPDGQYEYLKRFVSVEEAMTTAHSYTQPKRPAVLMGVIDRVIITDGRDCICFEWKNGEGVTFPPEMAGRK